MEILYRADRMRLRNKTEDRSDSGDRSENHVDMQSENDVDDSKEEESEIARTLSEDRESEQVLELVRAALRELDVA
ncbi:hypothetical protein R1flu_016673 [Riccia fluitans]|uniref:Uncharacterized protein n=1 Tax=Riccia fluitans TaxID=41844 RepID=A0ABD1YRD9_9MARC